MRGITLTMAGAALALSACAAEREPIDPIDPIAPTMLTADVRSPDGVTLARATVTESGDSLRVRVEAEALPPGAYGAHIHQTGRCDPPGFESAGGHWNPTNRAHGKDDPDGMHKGDLPNLLVGTDGRGSFEFTIPAASIAGRPNPVLDGDGAAVVVHAGADDYRTDPSGNSGARIGCGVLG